MRPQQREDRTRHRETCLTEGAELDFGRGRVLQTLVQEADTVFSSSYIIEQLALTRPAKFLSVEQETSLDFHLKLCETHSKTGLLLCGEILHEAP
ncbi:MAG: hypothetical protein WBE72_23305 [Terracidiphilus sp.]